MRGHMQGRLTDSTCAGGNLAEFTSALENSNQSHVV